MRLEVALNRKSDPVSKEVDVIVQANSTMTSPLRPTKAHELMLIHQARTSLRELRFAADFRCHDSYFQRAERRLSACSVTEASHRG